MIICKEIIITHFEPNSSSFIIDISELKINVSLITAMQWIIFIPLYILSIYLIYLSYLSICRNCIVPTYLLSIYSIYLVYL